MASYKERMENLNDLKKHFDFDPKGEYAARTYNMKEKSDSGMYKLTKQMAAEASAAEKKVKDEIAKKMKILDYLQKAKQSAIKRGVYNQSVYADIEAEAKL